MYLRKLVLYSILFKIELATAPFKSVPSLVNYGLNIFLPA